MPKVESISLAGLICWFWSNDHNPPHFHVKREGEWELRVFFLLAEEMFELIWGDPPKAKILKRIEKAVRMHRAEPLGEWEAKVNQ